MKKIFRITLLVSLLLVMLTACGGGAKPAEAPKAEAPKAEAPKAEAPKTDAKKHKYAVLINGNLGDKSFGDLVWNGVQMATKELGTTAKAVELMNDATKYEPTLNELSADKSWDLLIAGTFNLKESIEKSAKKNPDQKIIAYDLALDFSKGEYPNVVSVMSKQNEGSFLAGYLAAKMTSVKTEYTNAEKIIGFVGGGENAAINDFLVGYIEGAKLADPEVKILFSYIGSFSDTAKGKELALAQYNQGADIVYAVAGGAGLGVLDASKQVNKLSIGVDLDQAKIMEPIDKEISKHIMTSVVKKLDVVLYNTIKAYEAGTIKWGTHSAAGLKEDGMGLADNEYYQAIVPENLRNEVKDITKKVVSGEIKVSSAIGMSTEDVNKIKDRAGTTK